MSVIRPPYILAHLADISGCGHHRISRPMQLLARSGLIAGRCDMNIWQDGPLQAMSPDVVVWQRQHEDNQIDAMERYRKLLPNAYFIYELDDALGDVPEWSHHRSSIPYDVNERMVRAIAFCDAITVSTSTLGHRIGELVGSNIPIRVVPNMLGKDELSNVNEIRKTRRHPTDKLRIGWAGGISHAEDLRLLKPALQEFKDKVQWVFMGMRPETDVSYEFYEGVPPDQYLAKFASLDLDLVLAPIVDCMFNRCKSNLRLIESGACGYPVIASPVTPYLEGDPPVYSYAEDPDDWIRKIGKFIKDQKLGYKDKSKSLSKWMLKNYVFDDHAERRLKGWLPSDHEVFQPKPTIDKPNDNVIVISVLPSELPEGVRVERSFDAVADSRDDVLYIRPGTAITADQIKRLKNRLRTGPFASISPMSNDGGVCTYPKMGQYAHITTQQCDQIDSLCKEMFRELSVEAPFPAGPAILLSRRVIDLIGLPENVPPDQIEGAIIEWGVAAAARNFPNIIGSDVYVAATVQTHFENFTQILQRIQFRWPPMQVPPDPLKESRAHLEMAFHKNHYKSPPPAQASDYNEWASLLDTIGEADVKCLNEIGMRKKITYRPYPINTFTDLTDDDTWVVFYNGTSQLTLQVDYFIGKAIDENPGSVLIYADHDFVNDKGERLQHDFKPITIDRHLLLQRDYITPIFAVKSSAIKKAFPDFGSQPFTELDAYLLALRTIFDNPSEKVTHVPWVLMHNNLNTAEVVAEIAKNKMKVANDFLQEGWLENSWRRVTVETNPRYSQYNDAHYKPSKDKPLVSIIIVAGGRVEMLSPCIETLLKFTKYPNYEVLIINDATIPTVMENYQKTLKDNPKIRILRWPHPFNWSAKNNFGVQNARGEFYLFLNDDTRFMPGEWLDEMVGAAQISDVGAVGARLVYPHGLIQHVGVVCHEGLAGHTSKNIPESHAGYNGISILSHEATAVTGACLLVSKEKYHIVGGLDERFAQNFNDVVFCLELNRRGYNNVVAAQAMLFHVEGVTRISPITDEGMKLQLDEGKLLRAYMEPDKYWNHNLFFAHLQGGLFVSGLNHDLLSWEKPSWPWRGEDWNHDNILMIGVNPDQWLNAVRDGNVVYQAFSNGYQTKIVRPSVDNLPEFDLRDIDRAKAILWGFGITKIMVGSILGGVSELLSFVTSLGLPVEYIPYSAEAVCPRVNFQIGQDQFCNKGYNRGICHQCLSDRNSPFGIVSVPGWRDTWQSFLNSATLNDRYLNPESRSAIKEVYQHG